MTVVSVNFPCGLYYLFDRPTAFYLCSFICTNKDYYCYYHYMNSLMYFTCSFLYTTFCSLSHMNTQMYRTHTVTHKCTQCHVYAFIAFMHAHTYAQ